VSPDNRRTVKITGGTFQGSAVGIGHVEQHGATFRPDRSLDDLRRLLDETREQILDSGADDEKRARIAHELREIDEELADDEPDGLAVRTRWNSVLKVLDGALAAGTKIAGITELVHKIFGG
jgi:hypothetical protein